MFAALHLLLEGQRQEFGQAVLNQQRVPARHHRDIEITGARELDAGVCLVDAEPDGRHGLLAAQLVERAVGAVHCFLEAASSLGAVRPDVAVVDEQDVDCTQARAKQ
jgi:hypothetical protein